MRDIEPPFSNPLNRPIHQPLRPIGHQPVVFNPKGVPPNPPSPAGQTQALVVGVYDRTNNYTRVALYDPFSGANVGYEWVTYPGRKINGLASSTTFASFFAQDPGALWTSVASPDPIVSAAGGEPQFGPSSLVWNPSDQCLYVLGTTGQQSGILKYLGPGFPPPADPMYLPGLTGQFGMGLSYYGSPSSVLFSGLIVPQAQALSISPFFEFGNAASPKNIGPIPFANFNVGPTPLNLPGGVSNPCQGPDSLLYLLTPGAVGQAGTGIISIDLLGVLTQLNDNVAADKVAVAATVIVPVVQGLFPLGTDLFAVGPSGLTAPQSSEALLYVATAGLDAQGEATWSVQTVTTAGVATTLIPTTPGECVALCLQYF